ncbi:hypothetical protein BAUCODRAFT_25309 [Baudoinia panamericana UAMH 10762]|uniref:Uncharacterized protein n=1 Tax=Baudoinia panamericana (strain UAMH 10762) TaxID=717646 RepID=M2MUH0_BAUPA|nr:uncharacterized protein BAUCODRAFT_25309 [Baudoinia panamericana UAMH 10762]EMC95218.1 hypothetical protein BAUCODRAFT_25309 [Baudoinia panamericana UAMH 10762]
MITILEDKVEERDKELLHAELERLDVLQHYSTSVQELTRAKQHAAPVGRLLSNRLLQDAAALTKMIDPGGSLPVTELPKAIQRLQVRTQAARSQLARTRFALANQIQLLHEIYRQIVSTSIQTLEQTIHGSVARSSKAKADYLATVAEGMSKKLRVQHAQLLQQVYSPKVQEALKVRKAVMVAEMATVRRQLREAEEKIAKYRQAKGLEGIASEYAEVLKETRRVKEEIERLEKRDVHPG